VVVVFLNDFQLSFGFIIFSRFRCLFGKTILAGEKLGFATPCLPDIG